MKTIDVFIIILGFACMTLLASINSKLNTLYKDAGIVELLERR